MIEAPAIVVDNGGDTCKAGFAGHDAPQVVLPCVLGRPRVQSLALPGLLAKEYYVGEEALSRRGLLKLNCPIEHGMIQDWDGMEKIWHHLFFNELGARPEEHLIVITEPPLNPRTKRERTVQMMFETFNALAFYSCSGAAMALFASGRTTGVVVDSGDAVSHSVPVYEGYVLSHAIRRLAVGGRRLTKYLAGLLKGASLAPREHLSCVAHIKEHFCSVALDFDSEWESLGRSCDEVLHECPHHVVFSIGRERISCPELLFQGGGEKVLSLHWQEDVVVGCSLSGVEVCRFPCKASPSAAEDVRQALIDSLFPPPPDVTLFAGDTEVTGCMVIGSGDSISAKLHARCGIHEIALQSISLCGGDLQAELFGNVVLVGGSTMFPGFADRMKKEMQEQCHLGVTVNVVASECRISAAWAGASLLASLRTFSDPWISREVYEAQGPRIIHTRS